MLYTGLQLLGVGGCLLYAHPVAGNARLLHNPYRTIVMEKGNPSQEKLRKHLGILEHFIRALEALNSSALTFATEDYRLVDYSLFRALWPNV